MRTIFRNGNDKAAAVARQINEFLGRSPASETVSAKRAIAVEALSLLRQMGTLKDGERASFEDRLAEVIATHGERSDKVDAFKMLIYETSQVIVAQSMTSKEEALAGLDAINQSTSRKAASTLADNLLASGAQPSEIAKALASLELPPAAKGLAEGLVKIAAVYEQTGGAEHADKILTLERKVTSLRRQLGETEDERGRLSNGERIFR